MTAVAAPSYPVHPERSLSESGVTALPALAVAVATALRTAGVRVASSEARLSEPRRGWDCVLGSVRVVGNRKYEFGWGVQLRVDPVDLAMLDLDALAARVAGFFALAQDRSYDSWFIGQEDYGYGWTPSLSARQRA